MSSPTSDALLSLRGVELFYPSAITGGQQVLSGVDLELKAGQTLGLVGESGCGKSSLALGTMGLLSSSAKWSTQHAHFRGQDLPQMNAPAWRALRGTQMAMIFQNPMSALTPHLTIGEQAIEGPCQHLGLSKPDATSLMEQWLSKVQLEDPKAVMRKYPHQCSGGMCQRIMIAMTLCLEPALLIADEPTTALDVKSQAAVLSILSDLQREHQMALLIVSHDMAVIQQSCAFTAVMYAGQIVESGPTDAVIGDPQHPYTQNLLRAQPSLKGPKARLAHFAGQAPQLSTPPTNCPLHPRCPKATEVCRSSLPAWKQKEQHGFSCHEPEEPTP